MIWVSILKRKPKTSDFYYWKGKSNFGGKAYYHTENGFNFDENVPANKVDDEYLYWLDETDKYEKYQPHQSDVSKHVVTPIKIKVKLRQTQYLGFNQWKCNIHGEDRIVPMQWVEWYCMSIEDAVNSFKQHQVEEITINGNFS